MCLDVSRQWGGLNPSVCCHKAAYYSCRKRFTILPVTNAALVTLEVCIGVSSMQKISHSRDIYCRYLSSICTARISKRHRARSDEWLQLSQSGYVYPFLLLIPDWVLTAVSQNQTIGEIQSLMLYLFVNRLPWAPFIPGDVCERDLYYSACMELFVQISVSIPVLVPIPFPVLCMVFQLPRVIAACRVDNI